MGKRQIAELQVSEFIITVILSEIAAAPVSDPQIPLLNAIVPMLTLLSLELLMSYILLKSVFLRRLFCGTPTLLIHKGKLIQSALRKNRIELDELLAEIRQKGFSSIQEIRYAILEENGKLSVIPNAKTKPVTPADLSMNATDSGIAHPVIVDGNVMTENLPLASWNKKMLEKYLANRKLTVKDVFLLTVDDCGKVFLIEKEH